MRIDEISFAEYERLISEGVCEVDNPFVLPGAFRIWRRHYGEHLLKLQIYALWNAAESRCKAVFLSSSPLIRIKGLTLLRAMGTITGTELARASTYHGGYSPDELSRILALARTKHAGPVFKCNYLPKSALAAFAADGSPGSPHLIWMGSKHTRVIDKHSTFEDYLSTCPRADLREVQRVIRRLSSRGEIRIREFGGSS
ncbi:MAG: hypothetical protein Q7W29_00110, partial [bacterium]|nr:hypothetical protein [bacterium]